MVNFDAPKTLPRRPKRYQDAPSEAPRRSRSPLDPGTWGIRPTLSPFPGLGGSGPTFEAPEDSQDAWKRLPIVSRTVQDAPKWIQEAPGTAHDASKTP